jgi:hypothetical protein
MLITMRCPNCDQPVGVGLDEQVRFVTRNDTACYLVLAVTAAGTRLVHECGLRGAPR